MRYGLVLIVILHLIKAPLFSQTSSIQFRPSFGHLKLVSDSIYKLNTIDRIQITAFKFYISNIELINKNKSVWKDSISFHLVDAFNDKTLAFKIPLNIAYTKVKFNLGIDSITNVSGAMGGDLDPTKGMYWTWQSGYINFKLEGISNVCKTRNNEFQFHLGGYQYPYNNIQTIFLEVSSTGTVEVDIDVQKIINQINLSQQHHIMSPGKEAMDFSETLMYSLSIEQ